MFCPSLPLWKRFGVKIFKKYRFRLMLLQLSNSSVGGNSHERQLENLSVFWCICVLSVFGL